MNKPGLVARIGMGAGKVVATFNQAKHVRLFKQLSQRFYRLWPLWHCLLGLFRGRESEMFSLRLWRHLVG